VTTQEAALVKEAAAQRRCRILDLSAESGAQARDDEEALSPPPEGVVRWIDLAPSPAELELLRTRFGLHPLAIEDCNHFDQRPKLEEYPDHLFLVTQGFTCPGEQVQEMELHELHAFLGERWLITVRADDIPAVEYVWQRALSERAMQSRSVDFIYYLIADALVDSNFPILDRIADELEILEDHVLERTKRSDLERIFALKRHLVRMRKVLSPQRDTIGTLARRGHPRIDERTNLYFRDVYDHLVRINESIETNRDLLANALEAYLSTSANRTNEIMKSLTLLSAIFLPLAFVVGFFGQNFDDLPGLPDWTRSDGLMYVMIAICVGTPLVMGIWFRRKGWF
jgi:magnesium transporter